MFALSRVQRNAVAGAAVCTFAGAVALLPTQAGSRLGPPAPALLHAKPSTPAPAGPVAPLRDPFLPRVDESADGAATPAPSRGRLPELARLAPLPPNAGAGPFPFAAATPATQLRAVVTGPQPRALIEENGRTRLAGVGDRLAGARISAIDSDSVTLDDGRRLTLTVPDGAYR
jgi:hypothetical protein